MWQRLTEELEAEFGDIRAPQMLGTHGFHLDNRVDNKGVNVPSYEAPVALRIVELYSSGQTAQQTAEKAGVSENIVLRLLHKIGIPVRKGGRAPERKLDGDNLRKLKAAGKSNRTIAKELGVAHTSVAKALKR